MREDHKKEIGELKAEAKKDMKEMGRDIVSLTEKISRLSGVVSTLVPVKNLSADDPPRE